MTTEININTVQSQPNIKADSSKYSEKELQKLRKACSDFESIFTYQLLKTMRKTIPESKTGMSNYGKDTYMMMMDQKLAESISADGNGLGLKNALFDQLTKTYKKEIPKEGINKLK